MPALSSFAVFFSQSPSFLDSQVRMQKQLGRNNASSLFGVYEIPCDHQIRNLLDRVPPETVYPVMAEMGDALYQQGYYEWVGDFERNDPLGRVVQARRVGKKQTPIATLIKCPCVTRTRP